MCVKAVGIPAGTLCGSNPSSKPQTANQLLLIFSKKMTFLASRPCPRKWNSPSYAPQRKRAPSDTSRSHAAWTLTDEAHPCGPWMAAGPELLGLL